MTFRARKSEIPKENKKTRFVSDSKKVNVSGVLDKNIQTYRMWFLFLKLALELEQQGAVLIVRNNNQKGEKKGAKLVKKIKVNKKRYKGWDLEQVLISHFNDWWGSHSHLFLDEGIRILADGETVKEQSGYVTVRVNTNRRIRDVFADLRRCIEKTPQARHKSQNKFSVIGNVRPLALQNRYNALLLKMKGLSDKEILDFRNKHIRIADARVVKGYTSEHKSRLMYGLISGEGGAKQILLSVCDGYFLKNPNKSHLC
ncbi:MAG: hypothetical protein EBQ96_07550 [Proteobacteria bacterium]|nr:hypothetical protein [Pseudomonadota bacterium]